MAVPIFEAQRSPSIQHRTLKGFKHLFRSRNLVFFRNTNFSTVILQKTVKIERNDKNYFVYLEKCESQFWSLMSNFDFEFLANARLN